MFHSTHSIMKTSSHFDIYQLVTDLIIEKLEHGVIPWKKPWNDYGPAVNYISRKPYRGINQLLLNHLHPKPFYMTFRQATVLGGRIKKGAKSIPVTYWNFTYRDKESKRTLRPEEASTFSADQVIKTVFLKYYRVFNVDDILHVRFDIPEPDPKSDNDSIDRCEAVLAEMKDPPKIRHQEYTPYYHPEYDFINMPPIEQFKTSELYYSILFHEMIYPKFGIR